ncbi:MAG: hypothetical protein KBI32_04650 [Phycisphaerae bacterium]|nr:hypothetical protein [Phycisphaerae bacterium]HON90380.1 hypothetical protein [Sedimentisphaerales bacterium]
MKPNPNLDELLSSFIDGELSGRQRTEVQRMAAHDPTVARRLRQLQNCRTLFCSLPPAEAPGDMLEQIRQSLERRTLLQEHPVAARRVTGLIHLALRKFVAAAAMIALLAFLGAIVYQVVAPVSGPEPTTPVALDLPAIPSTDTGGRMPPMRVEDKGFVGRLEFQTPLFVSTDAFIQRAIDTCGLKNLAQPDILGNRSVYRVVGTRADVSRLVASLGSVWNQVESASLHVDPLPGATPVVVEAVTVDQAATVVACDNTEASIKTAQVYAAMNHMARAMPGSELPSLIYDDMGSFWAMHAIPMPKLTGPEKRIETTDTPAEPTAQASLTIVLLRSPK